jgi:hypothetical protein
MKIYVLGTKYTYRLFWFIISVVGNEKGKWDPLLTTLRQAMSQSSD